MAGALTPFVFKFSPYNSHKYGDKKITRRHILRQNNMCAEGKSAHTVFTEAFRRKKQYECFKIRGILRAMFLSAQINAAGFIRRKAEKFFYIFCSLRRTRLPCGEGADFSETAQAHCCPCAAFQGLKKHHVQFCLFSVFR